MDLADSPPRIVCIYVFRFTFYVMIRNPELGTRNSEPGFSPYESLTVACNVSLNCATSLSWAAFTSASVSVRSAAR